MIIGSFKFNLEKVEIGFQPMEGTDLLNAINNGSFVGSPFGDSEQENLEGIRSVIGNLIVMENNLWGKSSMKIVKSLVDIDLREGLSTNV